MVKFYETTTTFSYTWEQIVKAFWKRYPNPCSTHILTEDTLHREFRGNQLYSRRVLTKTYRLPKWGQKLVKSNKVPIVEESYIDPDEKIVTTYTRNIAFTHVMSLVEKVTYTPDPANPQQTIAYRSAWVDSNLYGVRRAVEKLGVEKFRKNCHQTAEGFNFVLRKLYPMQSRDPGQEKDKKEKETSKLRRISEIAKGFGTIFASSKST